MIKDFTKEEEKLKEALYAALSDNEWRPGYPYEDIDSEMWDLGERLISKLRAQGQPEETAVDEYTAVPITQD